MPTWDKETAIRTVLEITAECISVSRQDPHPSEDDVRTLQAQIHIWEAIYAKLADDEIHNRIEPADLAIYYYVMKRVYGVLRKRVKPETQKCWSDSDVADMFTTTDKNDSFTDAQQRQCFEIMLRWKEGAAWVAWNGRKGERFANEIEFWGKVLNEFSSWAFPSMFPEPPTADIVNRILDPSGALVATNLKARVMTARSPGAVAMDLNSLVHVEQGPFKLNMKHINFLHACNGELSPNDIVAKCTGRGQLGGEERRQWGQFMKTGGHEVSVIVEFKAHPSQDARFKADGNVVTHEMERLVRTFRTASTDNRTFRILYAEGWYEGPDRYGVVYRLPSHTTRPQWESLENILLKGAYRNLLGDDLQNRVGLAKALAWALVELHSVGWKHGSLRPDNILLCGEEVQGQIRFDWSAPYIIGFKSPPLDTGVAAQWNSKGEWKTQLYTHPAGQLVESEPNQKIYDMYSLGVVLLEIGKLSSFVGENKLLTMKPNQFKEVFIEEADGLIATMGKAYMEVVLACLDGTFGDADRHGLVGEFRRRVCGKLDSIRI